MRFGCCVNMVATGKDGVGAERIAEVAAAGFDYFELPLAGLSALDERAFEGILERVASAAIASFPLQSALQVQNTI